MKYRVKFIARAWFWHYYYAIIKPFILSHWASILFYLVLNAPTLIVPLLCYEHGVDASRGWGVVAGFALITSPLLLNNHGRIH